MKKILYSLAAAAGIVVGGSSCNEKLDLAAPYKNITVAYGLLDAADTAHYIRIQKAFMDNDKSGLDMAKVADSSFYRNLEVRIRELNGGTVLRTIGPLDRVDLNLEGYTKDTGVFFTTPSYGYKFKTALNPAYQYRVVILNTETGVVDSAVTPVIDNTLSNLEFGVREWLSPVYNFGFAKSDQKFTVDISVPAPAAAAQVFYRFRWVDSNMIDRSAVPHTADFTFGQIDTRVNKNVSTQVDQAAVSFFLRDVLVAAPQDNHYRYFDTSVDVYLYVAGEEYVKYRQLNQVSGGLTANEIRPVYTNFKGPDIMGLWSCRTYRSRLKTAIDRNTRDSMMKGTITGHLGIRFR